MITAVRKALCCQGGNGGFTLISLCMVIVIFGMFISAGSLIFKHYLQIERQEKTATNLALINERLAIYKQINGRLPCPAPLNAPIDSPAFGKAVATDCAASGVASGTFRANGRNGWTIRYGAVPVRELNLPENQMIDGWRRRIVYAVTEYHASGSPDFDLDRGAITVMDENDRSITLAQGNVIFALISPGEDARGAYNISGINAVACDTTAKAGLNCDFTQGSIRSSMYRQFDVGVGDYTATMSYMAGYEAYQWAPSSWGACNCASPVQTRTAQCVGKGGRVVSDVYCADKPQPALSQSCDAYCWAADDWGSCSCDSVMQIRAVGCRDNKGNTVGSGYCADAPTPVASRACNPTGCLPPSKPPPTISAPCVTTVDTDCNAGTGGGSAAGNDLSVSDETSRDEANGVSGLGGSSTGGSGGGGGSRVICTYFYRKGKMSRTLWRADLEFTHTNLFPCTVRGYQFWAIPYVRLMEKYTWAENFMYPMAMARAEEIAFQSGLRDTPNYYGRVIRWIMEPLCFLIGIFAPEQNWKKLYTARELAALR